MKVLIVALAAIAFTPQSAASQTLVTTLTLGRDQIGLVRVAQGITTRITFPESVAEIVCGDLYDSASGKGSFVVQRSGSNERPGNDVFIKPIASRGLSNLFVTTGDTRRHTYNFDLKIVAVEQAHRVVNVVDASPRTGDSDRRASADFEGLKAQAEEQAKQRAADIIRTAQQQADLKIAEANAKLAEADREASLRGDQEAERHFVKALMLGLREARILKPRTTAKKAIISLDPRVLTFDGKAYIRYTIQNTGAEEFVFSAIVLEVTTERGSHPLTFEVSQSKAENKLAKEESLTGVLVFDPKQVGPKDRLTLYVRGEDNSEIARLIIFQP